MNLIEFDLSKGNGRKPRIKPWYWLTNNLIKYDFIQWDSTLQLNLICNPIIMWFLLFRKYAGLSFLDLILINKLKAHTTTNTSEDPLRHLYFSTSESTPSKTLIKVTCSVAPRRIQTRALMIVDFILNHWVISLFVIYISCIYIYCVSNKY
jgi:hypothetical protein